MLKEMGDFPEFYYQPTPNIGDHDWIEGKLRRLNIVNRSICCAQYREIYLRQGRNPANNHLVEFVKIYGVSKKQYEKAQADTESMAQLHAKIEQIKAAQKQARPRLDLGDR